MKQTEDFIRERVRREIPLIVDEIKERQLSEYAPPFCTE